MGNKWEVYAYEKQANGEYDYTLEYAGESAEDAMAAAFKCKQLGIKCIKVMWRP